MGVGGQRHAPAALPPRKTRYPLYRRLGGPQGRSGQVRKISPPPGLDPRTVQNNSESLHRPRCPGPPSKVTMNANRWQAKRNLTKVFHRKAGFFSVREPQQISRYGGQAMEWTSDGSCFVSQQKRFLYRQKFQTGAPHSLLFKRLPRILYPVATWLRCAADIYCRG